MKDHSDLCYDKTCRTLAAIIVTQDGDCRWIATERMRKGEDVIYQVDQFFDGRWLVC